MGRFTIKSILFALATASVALVVNSAPSFNKNDGIELIDVSENTDFLEILPISKRSISDKQDYFATNAKTGHGGINKKAKQIANAAKRREERAERRKNGDHKNKNGRSDMKVEKNVVRTVKSEGKKKKTGKRPCGKKVCGKKKKYRKKVRKQVKRKMNGKK